MTEAAVQADTGRPGRPDRPGLPMLRPMAPSDVDAVYALECGVFPHPWSRANFVDSLANGYDAWVAHDAAHDPAHDGMHDRVAPDPGAHAGEGPLIGYFLLMYALDEAYLLDVAVAAPYQRRGLGRFLLERIAARARAMGMTSVFLEVRPSNERALDVYRRHGYLEIGRRKGYYPAHAGRREDAIVMRMGL